MEYEISVVVTTWLRHVRELDAVLNTLHRQTRRPAEIIVVDINPTTLFGSGHSEANARLCGKYGLARYIRAPRETFSLSQGINIGLRRTRQDVRYAMATGIGMLFSPNAIESIVGLLDDDFEAFVVAPCGFLRNGVEIPANPHKNWGMLCQQIDPNPPKMPFSPGTILATTREWWHHVRGYDETLPFAKSDSDIERRVQLDPTRHLVYLPWETAQCLHMWHELSPLVGQLGGEFPETDKIVRNPWRWGEIEGWTE